MVAGAAATHRVLLRKPETRQRLAGIENPGAGTFDGLNVTGRKRSGTGKRLQKIQRRSLARQQAARIAAQFSAYFRDPRCSVRLPVALQGTPFQCRVWQALQRIPAGETRSYGELAELLGTGARAVGNACRNNPLPIIIPCHRVIRQMGETGGYRWGIGTKSAMIGLESVSGI